MDDATHYDLTGLRCPMPIIELNRITKTLPPGESFVVRADDPAFCPDIEAWCNATGNELVRCRTDGETVVATLRRAA